MALRHQVKGEGWRKDIGKERATECVRERERKWKRERDKEVGKEKMDTLLY